MGQILYETFLRFFSKQKLKKLRIYAIVTQGFGTCVSNIENWNVFDT